MVLYLYVGLYLDTSNKCFLEYLFWFKRTRKLLVPILNRNTCTSCYYLIKKIKKSNVNKYMKKKEENRKPKPAISKADQDMIDELDYEYKKAHKPYDKWERHWDEA